MRGYLASVMRVEKERERAVGADMSPGSPCNGQGHTLVVVRNQRGH